MKSGGLLIAVLMLVFVNTAIAQHDSSYYQLYQDVFHGRLALILKNNTLHYKNTIEDRSVKYYPPTILAGGAGFTYNWVNLNLSYGFRLNDYESENGRTKYLDLQIHAFPKRFILNIFGKAYKGMHVPGDSDADGNLYHRPDLEIRMVGGVFQYVLNHNRFSFRSSFLQAGWQKRSAGSLLFGIETFVGRVTSDSSLLPYQTNTDPPANGARKDFFWQLGPNIGYAYTVVIKKHFFVTGSFAESFSYGKRVLTEQSGQTSISKYVMNPSYRLVAGYNADGWGITVNYSNNKVNFPGTVRGHELALRSGTFRINYVYRFRSKGKLGELIDRI